MLLAHTATPSAATTPATTGGDARAQAISCMTSAILHEAGFEPREGQEAVAEVILNRVRSSAFPKTICGVIFQGSQRRTGCQFSFTCDGSLGKQLPPETVIRAREVATRAIDGQLAPRTAGATHYHADYVFPYWAPTLVRVATIGRHIFYRPAGASELSQLGRYQAAAEQMPGSLGSGTAVSVGSATSRPPDTPRQPEKFMPWGLAIPATAPAQSSPKR